MLDTTRKEATRQRLIEAGAAIIHRQGYGGTGIQQVLDACGVPKGSFYHFFKSKEAFALAVLDFQAERLGAIVGPLLTDPTRLPLQRLAAFFDYFLGCYSDAASQPCPCGCPIGNLVQELASSNPAFRQRLDAILSGAEGLLAQVLSEARERGEVSARLDPQETACFIAASWQGAILRMKAVGDASPLVRCRSFIMNELLR